MDLRYPVTRYLYRPLSLPAASALSRTGITPVQVTWVSAAMAIGGAAAFAADAYLLGALLTFAGVITDCIDGDLARLTGRTSRRRAFLDSALDRWTDPAQILGLAYTDLDRYAGIAVLALVASLVTSYTRARAQSLGADCPDGIGGRDVRILILVVAALTDLVFAGLAVVAITGAITSAHRFALAGRALSRIDREEQRDAAPFVARDRGRL